MQRNLNRVIVCSDGFEMSVQANEHAYCVPRENKARKYVAVEIGFPSEREPLIIDYAEQPMRPTETVYAYVPASVVSLVCAKHGGVLEGQLPAGIPYLKAVTN